MGAVYKSLSCKESVPPSEVQRSHRRVTCWADVTLGAVILEIRILIVGYQYKVIYITFDKILTFMAQKCLL